LHARQSFGLLRHFWLAFSVCDYRWANSGPICLSGGQGCGERAVSPRTALAHCTTVVEYIGRCVDVIDIFVVASSWSGAGDNSKGFATISGVCRLLFCIIVIILHMLSAQAFDRA